MGVPPVSSNHSERLKQCITLSAMARIWNPANRLTTLAFLPGTFPKPAVTSLGKASRMAGLFPSGPVPLCMTAIPTLSRSTFLTLADLSANRSRRTAGIALVPADFLSHLERPLQ